MTPIELVPLLDRVRELYAKPLSFERFQSYLDMATSLGELALPISNLNPMAKDHAIAYVEELIALDAETVAYDEALRSARERSAEFKRSRLCVVPVDDLKGGWTNRTFTEFAYRYERKYEIAHGWVTVVLWTSETPSVELIRERTREAWFRTCEELRTGPVKTLSDIMAREGATMRFAGRTKARYDAATLAAIRATVDPHRSAAAAPIVFAALYGDEIAATLGYPPLGIPELGGYELALADELAQALAARSTPA